MTVTAMERPHFDDRYWPSDSGQRAEIGDQLNDVIAHIAAMTEDPIERDALAQYAGDQIRLHVATMPKGGEP